MKFFLLILTSIMLLGCSEQQCDKWEYASLSLSSSSIMKEGEVKEVNFIAIWTTNDVSLTWYDFQPMSGVNKLEYKEYFGAKTNHPISILDSLGAKAWEVYDYERRNQNEYIQLTEWQLKRCVK